MCAAPQARSRTMPALPSLGFDLEGEPAPGLAVLAEPSFEGKHHESEESFGASASPEGVRSHASWHADLARHGGGAGKRDDPAARLAGQRVRPGGEGKTPHRAMLFWQSRASKGSITSQIRTRSLSFEWHGHSWRSSQLRVPARSCEAAACPSSPAAGLISRRRGRKRRASCICEPEGVRSHASWHADLVRHGGGAGKRDDPAATLSGQGFVRVEKENSAPGDAVLAEPSFKEKHHESDQDQKLSCGWHGHSWRSSQLRVPACSCEAAACPSLPSCGFDFEKEGQDEESFGASEGQEAPEPILRGTPIFHLNLAEPVVALRCPRQLRRWKARRWSLRHIGQSPCFLGSSSTRCTQIRMFRHRRRSMSSVLQVRKRLSATRMNGKSSNLCCNMPIRIRARFHCA